MLFSYGEFYDVVKRASVPSRDSYCINFLAIIRQSLVQAVSDLVKQAAAFDLKIVYIPDTFVQVTQSHNYY